MRNSMIGDISYPGMLPENMTDLSYRVGDIGDRLFGT
jgi:hypothetical protein